MKDNWAGYEIQSIGLSDLVEKVIPFLRSEKTTVSMNLSPEGQNVLVAPEKLLLDIKNYFVNYGRVKSYEGSLMGLYKDIEKYLDSTV